MRVTLLLAVLAAGCGGAAPPSEARTNTVAAMQSARTIGAAEEPRASYHLELAREQLAQADALIARGEMMRAQRVLERAETDAVLAIALTRDAELSADAEETRQRLRELSEAHL
jgi:hypothetical protein